MIYCVKAISFLISHIATFWYLPKVMRTRKLFTSPQTQTNPSNLPRWHPRADNLFTCFLFFISVLSTFPQKLPFLFLCCNVFTIDRTHYLVMTCMCWHDYYSSCNQFLCHMYASVSRRNDNRVFKDFCNFFFFIICCRGFLVHFLCHRSSCSFIQRVSGKSTETWDL